MCNEVGANDIINMVWDINVIGLHTKEMIADYLNIIQERNLAEMAKPGNLRQFKINGKRLEFLSSYSILLADSLARFPVIYLQWINTSDCSIQGHLALNQIP